jgi:fatty acid desaturase
MSEIHIPVTNPDRSRLIAALAPFQVPSLRSSVWQFASTFGGYIVLNAAMYALIGYSPWLVAIIALPTAGFLVRLFIIQQDCGHGSSFRSRQFNDMLGRFAACSPLHLMRSGDANTRTTTGPSTTWIGATAE